MYTVNKLMTSLLKGSHKKRCFTVRLTVRVDHPPLPHHPPPTTPPLIMTLRVSDWQSGSYQDSIRNSCDVFLKDIFALCNLRLVPIRGRENSAGEWDGKLLGNQKGLTAEVITAKRANNNNDISDFGFGKSEWTHVRCNHCQGKQQQ